jgi:hypothetical protein
MKARNNPTPAQILRRLRRPPDSDADPRYKNDAYWALRLQGHPHAYAKRAFRDEPPKAIEQRASDVDEYLDGVAPDDILFPAGSSVVHIEVATRPLLTQEAVAAARPRVSEYTIWDGTLRTFGLRVRPTGSKSFVLYLRVRGEKKLRKMTLGRAGTLTLQSARQMAHEFLYQARMGREPGRQDATARKRII